MKVVKKEAPTEEVKVTNLFGDEYTPDEYEFICDDCLAEEVESLKEDVIWLAKDILDHDDVLEMLWGKVQAVEDDQLQDVENLSSVVDIIGCLQEAHKLMLDIIIKQNETISLLSNEVNKLYNGIIFLTIWSLVLTILTVVISLNVFF